MSQGDKEALGNFMKAIIGKINDGDCRIANLFSKARIYKVPEDLRKLNKCAYNPRVIAIGPLHRKDKHLKESMEHVKRHYTHQLVARLTSGINDNGKKNEKIQEVLQKCAEKMNKEYVERAKRYYAEEIKMNDDEMSEMMLFDGCFILELLYATHRVKKHREAGKSTANGGDGGNPKAPSSSVQQPANEGEDGSSGSGEQPMYLDPILDNTSSSSVQQLANEGEDGSSGSGEQPMYLDPILDNILFASIIKNDLILFENQIPFFVLEDLFKLTVDQIPFPGGKKPSLKEYVVWYFSDIMSPEGKNSGSEEKTTSCCSLSDCHILWVCGSAKENEQEKKAITKANNEYEHILHLLHDHYGPSNKGEDKENPAKVAPRKFSTCKVRASELEYGGVKFVSVEGNNLLDVKFTEPKGIRWWFYRATFEIPTLNVHDPTEPFLRNLIAFEQFRPGVSRYITSYAKLMDVLINSEKDVQVLSKANVIRNFLGTDEVVSDLLNKLCREVVARFFFEDACQRAFEYSQCFWPRYMAYWRRTYVASPWAFIGFCLALIAFGIQITNFTRSFIK